MTARGTLERREMVLLRLRTDEGVDGLGEAVPLSLRGGETLSRVERSLLRLARRLARLDVGGDDRGGAAGRRRRRGDRRGRRAAAARAGQGGGGDGHLRPRRPDARGSPLWRMLRGESAPPLRCNATLGRRLAARARRRGGRAGGSAASRPSSSSSGSATTSDGRGRSATRSARTRACGWTPTAPGAPIGPWPCWTRSSRSGSSWPSSPRATLREMAAVAAATADPDRRRRERDQRQGREASGRGRRLPPGHREAGEGRRDRPGAERSRAELPVYLSSALDGPVGIAAAAHAAQALYRGREDPGSRTASPPRSCSPTRSPRRECEVRDGLLHLPEGPGLGVEIDERALERHRL